MARAAHLIFWMLMGCTASTLWNWLAVQLPQTIAALIAANLIVLLIWGACWVLDDGVIKLTRIDPYTYYAALLGLGLAYGIGLGVYIWIYHPNL